MCPDCSPPKLYSSSSISSNTNLSPTFVAIKLTPFSSQYFINPILVKIVPIAVFLASLPLSIISFEQIAIIWSPSTSSPFSSTHRHLSASPSNATPISNLFSTTYLAKFSICVEPQHSLIFIPSGSLYNIFAFAPNPSNRLVAVTLALPFAQSTAIFNPSSEVGIVLFKCSM